MTLLIPVIAGLVFIYIVTSLYFSKAMPRWVVIAFIAALFTPYLMMVAYLGMPRPHWAATFEKMEVISFLLSENKGIYLWVIPEGENIPIALKLPWNTKQANQIILYGTRAEGEGKFFGLRFSDGGTLENWNRPVLELPLKNGLP